MGGFSRRLVGQGRAGTEAGMLRIDFLGYSGAGKLERIDWDEFFEKFEESKTRFTRSRQDRHGLARPGLTNSSARDRQ